MKSDRIEALARALAILSFIALCWVSHRALQIRETCVSSSFIAFIQIDGRRVENCRFSSRLSLGGNDLNQRERALIRSLEMLEPLVAVFPNPAPSLAVEISRREPRAFALGRRALRLGVDWLGDPGQLRRALIMALIRPSYAENIGSFQIEVLTDFLSAALFVGEESRLHDLKFPTAALSLSRYCESPLRSLAHVGLCTTPVDDAATEFTLWSFRPLLASALYRAFLRLSLKDQIDVLRRVRSGESLPDISGPDSVQASHLAAWFQTTFGEYALSLGIRDSGGAGDLAFKRALKELEVEAPTRWELTVDLMNTPAWKEIVDQLKMRSRYRAGERALLFTPEGELALPSGLPVEWSAEDVQSQKHVMIACHWPSSASAVHVKARQMFAEQTCGKLKRAFWD